MAIYKIKHISTYDLMAIKANGSHQNLWFKRQKYYRFTISYYH